MSVRYMMTITEASLEGMLITVNGALSLGWELHGSPMTWTEMTPGSSQILAGQPKQPTIIRIFCQCITWAKEEAPVELTSDVVRAVADKLSKEFDYGKKNIGPN